MASAYLNFCLPGLILTHIVSTDSDLYLEYGFGVLMFEFLVFKHESIEIDRLFLLSGVMFLFINIESFFFKIGVISCWAEIWDFF